MCEEVDFIITSVVRLGLACFKNLPIVLENFKIVVTYPIKDATHKKLFEEIIKVEKVIVEDFDIALLEKIDDIYRGLTKEIFVIEGFLQEATIGKPTPTYLLI